MTSAADFLMGVGVGVLGVFAAIGILVLAVKSHAREVDAWFNRQVSPVPSHVRIVAAAQK
jgi:hypothetical protein